MAIVLVILSALLATCYTASQQFTLAATTTQPFQWSFSAGASGTNPTLNAAVGDTLTFNVNTQGAFHPFSVHTSNNIASTARSSAVVPPVYQGDGTSPTPPVLTITSSMAGQTLYYCCENHPTMVGQIVIGGGSGPSPSPSPSGSTPTPPAPSPFPPLPVIDICYKYAKALNVTETQLMTTLVTAVVKAELGDTNVLGFFNGTIPAGSIDFTTNMAQYNRLAGDLIAFFGAAIGCVDRSFPKYTGNPDMVAVHAGMGIDRSVFDDFVNNFISAIAAAGVTAADQATVATVLNSFAPQIVDPTLICPKYAKALGVNETALMTAIVSAVVGAELKDPSILGFFNGTLPAGSIDFTTNTAQYNRLAGDLIAFFGAALGCKDSTFPKYTGNPDMIAVHINMPIGRDEMDTFINIFNTTLSGLGVLDYDLVTVRLLLESFIPQIVHPTLICPKYAAALGVNETALMTAIVSTVVGAELKDPDLVQFFNGKLPPNSIDFTTNTAQYNRLAGDLIAFFGIPLGCADPTFPKYTASTDMAAVHAKMPIDKSRLDNFNNIFISALAGLGVTNGDQETVLNILDEFITPIVNPTYICQKYATALGVSQTALMTTIVGAVVGNELKDYGILGYFNGTIPSGATDFTTNMTAYNTLAGHLVAFFGSALGCTASNFPAYAGNPDMKAVHAQMMIDQATFDLFNAIFLDTLTGLGVTLEDRNLVSGVLNSFQGAIVNPGGVTPPPPGTGGDPDLVAAGYTFNQPVDCGIVVYWKPVAASDTSVSFAVRRSCTGFVGLGIPIGGMYQMIGSDAVVGWGGSSPSAMPYHLEGKALDASQVVPNTMYTITENSATQVNGVTTVYFTREFATGYNPITNPAAVTIVASTHDTSDALAYHTCRVNQAYVINLYSGNGTAGPAEVNRRKDAHGALMIIGWGLFMVLGVISARFGKGLGDPLWFNLHRGLNTLALMLITAGFITAWVMVDGVFFNTKFHSQLGLTVMILVYLQFLMGIARPHKEEGADITTARKIFEFAHPVVGWSLLVLSSITIFAGISTWWPYWVIIVYAFSCFCWGSIIALLQLMGKAGNGNETV